MKSKIGLVLINTCLAAVVLVFASPTFAKRGGPGPRIPLRTPVITAEQAVGVVTAALPKLVAGKYWVRTGPRGDTKMNVALILDDRIVSRVELNPATGAILPKGQAIFVNQISADPDQAVTKVRQAIPNLRVAAARLGKDGEWKVELILNRAVIADIDVHSRDSSILTDWGASREATLN